MVKNGGEELANNRKEQKKQRDAEKIFQEAVEELYQASESLEKIVSLFGKIKNNAGSKELRKLLEEIGNDGKTTLNEEMDLISGNIGRLKSMLLTHKLEKRSRK